MDQIVEAILKLKPFSWVFKKMGLNDDLSALFSVILIVLLVTLLSKLFTFLLKRYKFQKKAIEDIKPQFDHLSIKKARQFYIQTQYQNASPARQEEPGFTHKYIARNKLIPFFIKTAFNEKADSERFYLILADSGMGKTTFMINLYLRYNSFFAFRNYEMKLFRFTHPDTISRVKSIEAEDAKKTILLLDALDEDQGIISTDPNISDAEAFQNRIDEIIEITKNFREIIITCRTQYFPGQEEDPYELKIKRPDEKGFYILNKIYISPFNEKEVKSYLNKKFGVIPFINRKKKKRALKIVSKSKNLVMRPMLLSYIDYLIQDEVTNDTTTNIYKTLVTKWLQREAEKRKGLANRETFITNLRKLSFKTAIAIYSNWRKEGRIHLSKEEALRIAWLYDIILKPEEITGQSLLTCDGVGNWKFAHKSILEFLLANEAVENPKFLKLLHFKGMDMARKFYEELNPHLTFIDKSTSWDGNDYEFYIYNNLYSQAYFFDIFKNDQKELTVPLITKSAITYCNNINIKHGYSPVYDLDFNAIDPYGKITTNITEVRGFRFPTKNELQRYIAKELSFKYFESLENIKGLALPKTTLKITLDFTEFEFKAHEKPTILKEWMVKESTPKEWCHNDNETNITLIELSQTKPRKNAIHIADVIENSITPVSLQNVKPTETRFRLVFIP